MFEFIGGITAGWLILIGYASYRAVNTDGWDDSNILNWLRMFSLLVIHPEVFVNLYRLTDEQIDTLLLAGYDPLEPFDFLRKDEFSENFPKTRDM